MNLFGRRRRILIDRLQFTLLGINLLHLLVIVGAFIFAIFTPAIIALYREASPEMSLAAATEFLNLHKRIWPATALALLLIASHSVHVSHRIAGPLYRFRRVFESLGRGDLTQRTGVRRKDYLRRDAEAINAMIEGLAGRATEIRDRTVEAQTALSDLVAVASRTEAPELNASIGRLGLHLDRLGESVGRLHVPPAEAPTEAPTEETLETDAGSRTSCAS